MNITKFCLEQSTKDTPNKIALILASDVGQEKTYTYQNIYQMVAQLTAGLKSLGYPPGSRIVIRSHKNLDFILIYFAAMAASLVPIASLSDVLKEDVLRILEDSEAVLFYQTDALQLNLDLPNSCKLLTQTELQELKKFSASNIETQTEANDPAYIVYTSGSTGKPKGIVHAHRSILGRELIRKYWLSLNTNDVVLITGKPCWTYTMGVGFKDTWASGATSLVYTGPIYPDVWFKLIEHYKVTLFVTPQ